MREIKEIIIVEGRDDTAAIKRALEAVTIETHGFGIKPETWELIETAYHQQGIIIFTDPDFAGNEIRRRLKKRFPEAKEAFLSGRDAKKDGDIGIENGSPGAIREALKKAKATLVEKRQEFTMQDLLIARLTGAPDASIRRDVLGKMLGIGYGNSTAFLNKLNQYNVCRGDFNEALCTINDKRD